MGKESLPCNLPRDLYDDVYKQFQRSVSDNEREQIESLFDQYLFYVPNKSGTIRECECTHYGCGKFQIKRRTSEEFFGLRHRDKTTCPNCGKPVTVLAKNKFQNSSSIQQKKMIALFRPGKDGSLLITHGVASREYARPDFLLTEFREHCRTYLAPGIRMQWEYSWYRGGWYENSCVYEPFRYADYPYLCEFGYHLVNPGVILQTDLRYCHIGDYINDSHRNIGDITKTFCSVVSYLSAYVEYPNMEMAARLGMKGAIDDLILHGKKNVHGLNWKADNIQDFLKLEKSEVKEFLAYSRSVSLLAAYHRAKKNECTPNLNAFICHHKTFEHSRYYYDLLVDAAARSRCSLTTAENYVAKQAKGSKRSFETVLQFWIDYLRNAKLIGYTLKEHNVSMPKDLEQKHDDAAATANLLRTENHRKMGPKRAEKLSSIYGFEYGGLVIIVPESADAIVAEGNSLCHCVGGYAARHMAGKLDILFLRKADHPEESMVPIEMAPRKSAKDAVHMRQIHGYRNDAGKQPASKKYAWFIEVWKEWMLAGSPRDKQGNPLIQVKEATA